MESTRKSTLRRAGRLASGAALAVAELEVGDVITYTPPAGDHLITHRIVSIDGEELRTKGDANPVADPWTFRLEGPTQARVRAGVPFAGHALTALARRDVRLIVIALPALLIAGAAMLRLWRRLGALEAAT